MPPPSTLCARAYSMDRGKKRLRPKEGQGSALDPRRVQRAPGATAGRPLEPITLSNVFLGIESLALSYPIAAAAAGTRVCQPATDSAQGATRQFAVSANSARSRRLFSACPGRCAT